MRQVNDSFRPVAEIRIHYRISLTFYDPHIEH